LSNRRIDAIVVVKGKKGVGGMVPAQRYHETPAEVAAIEIDDGAAGEWDAMRVRGRTRRARPIRFGARRQS
jgi:hypothetical protein